MQDKRIEKGEQTRVRILNSAIGIITEEGIKEVSAAKLASATGMSKSNIFHHFRSIDEILLGVLDIIFSKLLKSMDMEYENLEEFLKYMGQSVFDVPEEHLKLFKAFFSFYHEGMFNVEYQKLLGSCAEQIRELIYKQLLQLLPDDMDHQTLKAAATLLLSIMDGMGLHYLLNKDRTGFEQAWGLQVKLICRLLSKQ